MTSDTNTDLDTIGEVIGQLRVYSGLSAGEWRNVRRYRDEQGIRYCVEGWSGYSTTCPLKSDNTDSRWFIDPRE
jgi:hypothetical protein